MKLDEIKKPYDLIVSLGSSCSPAAHLRRNHLRKFSMPFDWIVTPNLPDVGRVIQNQFQNFMLLENLRLQDGQANFLDDTESIQTSKAYFVQDIQNNMLSVHDFPVHSDLSVTYPAYRQKLDRRIERFLLHLQHSSSVLFIRWAGTAEQAIELQQILRTCTSGSSDLLLLSPVDNLKIMKDTKCAVDEVCIVNVPNQPEDAALWDIILKGISLNP
ncbi:DUF1796 family putative cysteine peptidase [Guptibacillus hwajinpoensis]|uniref:DUF1796 family putative cysteine peptidase n=1 Tax=Guptibacillus hwajinpoensis TaxID=208199 RepID=UPI001CD6FB7E|nr:DUF1796 family putative cysteine peptidase [Pseudalkalibacillus hwajinpoensis]MCA0993869.1 papain-like cysteine peptidase [Pseudalkalibacillus hwajinpoensis]